jgi:O-methyltransferase
MKLFGLKKRRDMMRRVSAKDHPDIDEPDFLTALEQCRPATMTSKERLYALYSAVRYVADAGIAGDFVECGVWKGGSVMMMALTLRHLGITDRDIYLFDTFTGQTTSSKEDVDYTGVSVTTMTEQELAWLRVPAEQVRANLATTGYPMERFHLVPGDVRQTIPGAAPERIALLRLDTDWYESTRHELENLFPRLAPRGPLIVDDYGHFRGSRQAVDEFLARQPTRYFLQRVDYTARLLLKA